MPGAHRRPCVSRTEANVNLTAGNLPAEVAGKKTFGVHWTGFLTPPNLATTSSAFGPRLRPPLD